MQKGYNMYDMSYAYLKVTLFLKNWRIFYNARKCKFFFSVAIPTTCSLPSSEAFSPAEISYKPELDSDEGNFWLH